jgi:ganglioside GM2 activator
MMFALLFALCVAGSFANEYTITAFSNECGNCGSSGDALRLTTCSITPAQISFPGTLSFDIEGSLSQNISAPIKLEVTIQKQIGIWITVPCINETLGSCTFNDLCQLQYLSALCPVASGQIKNTLTLPLPSIAVPDEVAGNYKLKAVVSHDGGEVGCLYLDVSIAKTIHA